MIGYFKVILQSSLSFLKHRFFKGVSLGYLFDNIQQFRLFFRRFLQILLQLLDPLDQYVNVLIPTCFSRSFFKKFAFHYNANLF